MLRKLHTIDNIQEIINQVNNMDINKWQNPLNHTTGNILTGDYTLLPELVDTPLGDFLNSLGDIGEARLLLLESGDTYTAHTDPDDRIHLVISTNPYCYLIDIDHEKMYHLPVDGQVWSMDTGIRHVASNFGGKPRIHLNVRERLPKITYPCYKFSIAGGDYDWKQELYDGLMSYLNLNIKTKQITGIEKINDREMLLNCDVNVANDIIYQVYSKGFTVEVTEVTPTLQIGHSEY
jgi:hypothetical protein